MASISTSWTFHQFQKLPTELQDLIWFHFLSNPRIIHCRVFDPITQQYLGQASPIELKVPIPQILPICRSTREVARRVYSYQLAAEPAPRISGGGNRKSESFERFDIQRKAAGGSKSVGLNFETDIFDMIGCSRLPDSCQNLFPRQMLQNLRSLMLRFSQAQFDEAQFRNIAAFLQACPKLREVFVVVVTDLSAGGASVTDRISSLQRLMEGKGKVLRFKEVQIETGESSEEGLRKWVESIDVGLGS